jgi:hypothetical protein
MLCSRQRKINLMCCACAYVVLGSWWTYSHGFGLLWAESKGFPSGFCGWTSLSRIRGPNPRWIFGVIWALDGGPNGLSVTGYSIVDAKIYF